jgi:NADH:ubiquinone oxidoreductase subunit 3 (subunit A)
MLFGGIGVVFMMGVVGVVLTIPVVLIPKLLAPKKPNPIKNAPFECGQVPVGAAKMQYYAYLLIFIVFAAMARLLKGFGWTMERIVKELGAVVN